MVNLDVNETPQPPKKSTVGRKVVYGDRDAKLQFLGRMSPEEQLDKFLQSVEEVNAENEMILTRPRKIEKRPQQQQPLEEHSNRANNNGNMFNKNKNLRRENSSIANRWHSMDSLNAASAAPVSRRSKRSTTATESTERSSSASSSSKQTSSRKSASYREINGPKSFLSMSQLDSYQQQQQQRQRTNSNNNKRLRSSAGGKRSTSSGSRRASPMEVSSSTSHSEGAEMRKTPPKHLFKVSHRTKVAYLGSLPLSGQSSDLASLQVPLKELYFQYLDEEDINNGSSNNSSSKRQSNSNLEITDTGLKVSYMREQGVVQEIFNPFPTIAVWAAVRFIYKRELNNNFSFAFLPLISDPGDAEKKQLFNPLAKRDLKHAASNEHPAMFACIMRRNGVPKLLECHGFVCHSKDDAILIASNLYKSLMETMKKQQQQPVGNRNNGFNGGDSTPTAPPTRPPRGRRKKSGENDNNNNNNVNRPKKVKRCLSEKQFPNDEDANNNTNNVRRTISERRSLDDSDVATLTRKRRGDIYTKVAMPRSKSFMNVSGQYNLQELFKELREKEGVESIDDILRHVINPNGMSFNKISPVYRELLMKLAMSMSRDEIFIRSKNIMMEEKLKKAKEHQHLGIAGKVLTMLGVSKKPKAGVKKTEIGSPMPVSDEAKRALSKQWTEVSPHLTDFLKESANKLQSAAAESSYVSCSECRYQSVCSCSGMLSTDNDEDDSASVSTVISIRK